MRTAGLVLLLVTVSGRDLPAQETTIVTISVTTKDSNVLSGTTDVTTFVVETSLGKLTVSLKDITNVRWVENVWIVSMNDGTSLKGKISQESWSLKTKFGDFTVKSGDIQIVAVQGVKVVAPAPPPSAGPAAVPAPGPNAAPPKAPANPAAKPAKTLKLAATITRSIRSADGKKLYLLNASDSKVIVVNLESFEKEKEIALAGGEASMALSPSGNILMAGGKGTVTSVSLKEGKVTKTFSIEGEVMDIAAIDDQTAVATTNATVVMISIPKQAVVGKSFGGGGGGGRLLLSKDGKKVYTGQNAVMLPDKSQGREELQASPYSRPGGGAEFVMSPDGRFATAPQGIVYRLGKSYLADMVEVARVEVHWSSAWGAGGKRLFVLTSLGFVKEYDTETFEMARSWFLGFRMSEFFVDEAGTALVGVGQAVPANQSGETVRYANQPGTTGDLFRFDIPKP